MRKYSTPLIKVGGAVAPLGLFLLCSALLDFSGVHVFKDGSEPTLKLVIGVASVTFLGGVAFVLGLVGARRKPVRLRRSGHT